MICMANKRSKGKRRMRDYASGKDRNCPSPKEEMNAVKDTERNNTFGGNAIEWFARYPNLLQAAGSIPYPYRPGMKVPLGGVKRDPSVSTIEDIGHWIPGMLGFYWVPSVGRSLSPTSPISVVGKELYAKVREKFSGSIDADAPDFVIYLMALDSIFSYIAMLKRIYRSLNAYSPDNLFTPNGVLHAMLFNDSQIEDMRQHKMELYQRINELILMTYKFKCPRIMDVFNRHVWLNDHVYTDAPTPKSQWYIFVQTEWYKFEMLDVPHSTPAVQAGGLKSTQLLGNLPDTGVVQALYTNGRSLINALAESDDGYLISGYLMRAFEGYPDFRVDELLMGEFLVPKYNEEVLGEIENLHTLSPGYYQLDNDVYQDPSTNSIICTPYAYYAAASDTATRDLDHVIPRYSARSDNPTIAETVINSRMMTYIDNMNVDGSVAKAEVIACSEIMCSMQYIVQTQLRGSGGLGWSTQWLASEMVYDLTTLDNVDANLKAIAKNMDLAQWDWCPMILAVFNSPKKGSIAFFGDIHNMTSTTKETLINLNTVCLYSLFNAFNI